MQDAPVYNFFKDTDKINDKVNDKINDEVNDEECQLLADELVAVYGDFMDEGITWAG